ncbi:long-chain-fatty-acid--CoA ligase [Sphingomonas paeninsulae]|uniref:3-methylmercaptopropionyl-CoA ligase n=1 Tax=Sphingomonas paeninsulae TaxID=2319844 RepID=A0A494TPG1_SPHPE|nr:fatty acyl-CoA synthetase [Sphingomonas paeninsulae]AYJ87741.1 long-chain-fatty-acid--CoA ligase [Sphingomonas paeninsulae]
MPGRVAADDHGARIARRRNVADIVRAQASRRPEKTALIYEGRRDTFANLDELVDRAANALRELGIGQGDRVAIFSHNNRAFVVLRFAIARAGAIMVPINFMLGCSEVAYILQHAQCRMVIAEDTLCETADAAIALCVKLVCIRASLTHTDSVRPAGWIDGDALLTYHDTTPVYGELEEDEPVQIMYTSGTESRPKGVVLTSRGLFAQYTSCALDGGMEADDVELHCLPLYHCAQLDCFLTVDIYIGATSVLLRGPDPAIILATIESEKITKLFCPPTVWTALLRHPDFVLRDLSTLQKAYYGASIMPTALIEELLERLPSLRLWNFYGQTEMSPLATVLQPEDQLTRLGSAGKPAINVETKIVDEYERDVAFGEVGEIVHRSPQAMLGYLDDPTRTAEAFRGGWLHTGDLGRFDEDGFLYVVDRKKDMIKSGGENVASREVEEVLFRHAAIAEAAVIGLPDPRWIEAVTAVIVLRPGFEPSDDDLHRHCKGALAPFKRPKRFITIDALPKNASGKILKRELRMLVVDENQDETAAGPQVSS